MLVQLSRRELHYATSGRSHLLKADQQPARDAQMPQVANTPQMFDWIFFAIILLPSAYLVWDWIRNR